MSAQPPESETENSVVEDPYTLTQPDHDSPITAEHDSGRELSPIRVQDLDPQDDVEDYAFDVLWDLTMELTKLKATAGRWLERVKPDLRREEIRNAIVDFHTSASDAISTIDDVLCGPYTETLRSAHDLLNKHTMALNQLKELIDRVEGKIKAEDEVGAAGATPQHAMVETAEESAPVKELIKTEGGAAGATPQQHVVKTAEESAPLKKRRV